VSTFEELEANADKARGKIVLFNAPFTSYGETVAYRARGADAASAVRLSPSTSTVQSSA
jgi:carboxypeptidase Q